jgi:hypothetical protein
VPASVEAILAFVAGILTLLWCRRSVSPVAPARSTARALAAQVPTPKLGGSGDLRGV